MITLHVKSENFFEFRSQFTIIQSTYLPNHRISVTWGLLTSKYRLWSTHSMQPTLPPSRLGFLQTTALRTNLIVFSPFSVGIFIVLRGFQTSNLNIRWELRTPKPKADYAIKLSMSLDVCVCVCRTII